MTFSILRTWELASLVMFGYTAALAAIRPGLSHVARARIAGGSAAGMAFTAASALSPSHFLVQGLFLPPLLLLLAYWTTGLLFTAPMARVERMFLHIDATTLTRSIAATVPRWTAEYLEVSYAAVYALIPITLALYLAFTPTPDLERFWTVILVTDYLCFAMLPWIQTRPPRALERQDPWRSSFRTFNLRLLGAASIRVNTFPSGHAAEALVAALLVLHAPLAVVIWMLFNALSVSAGAVLGRYHYAVDAATGWMVALAVWWMLA